MPTNMQKAASALWRSVKSSAAVSVTYTQDSTSLSLDAVPGTTRVDAESADGMVRTHKEQDFIVNPDDLFGLLPTRGDRIVWGDRTFEVLHVVGGRPYQVSDVYGTMWRIHCKEVYG